MISSEEVIILRTIKQGESNMVIHCYNSVRGRDSLFIKGIKGKNRGNNIGHYLFSLNILDCTIYRDNKSNLGIIKEANPLCRLDNLRINLHKYAISQFMAELIYKSININITDPEIYSFIIRSTKILNDLETNYANIHLYFTVKLCEYLGYKAIDNWDKESRCRFNITSGSFCNELSNDDFVLSNRLSYLLHLILSSPIDEVLQIPTNGEERANLLKWMIRYLSSHSFSNLEIKSLNVLKELFD